MNRTLYKALIEEAREHITATDPSHDLLHALRVLGLVQQLQQHEGGDVLVLVPAALFHDVINPPKGTPGAATASQDSGEWTARLLRDRYGEYYTPDQIDHVARIIARCSYSKNIPKDSIEGWILQDADLLESIGAIAVARTFCSAGQLQRPFYHETDPFAKGREVQQISYALDLFPSRLFQVEQRLHTKTAQKLGASRVSALKAFYTQMMQEIAYAHAPLGAPS